jgi:nitric-oxide synthase
MSGCPFHSITSSPPPPATVHSVEAELAFLAEAHPTAALPDRLAAVRAALAAGQPAPLSTDELTWAGRIAWRNHSRCIGRLYWKSLLVRDHRHLDTADALAESLREHLTLAQGEGMIRSILTVFSFYKDLKMHHLENTVEW